jgi:hypothetical protein
MARRFFTILRISSSLSIYLELVATRFRFLLNLYFDMQQQIHALNVSVKLGGFLLLRLLR